MPNYYIILLRDAPWTPHTVSEDALAFLTDDRNKHSVLVLPGRSEFHPPPVYHQPWFPRQSMLLRFDCLFSSLDLSIEFWTQRPGSVPIGIASLHPARFQLYSPASPSANDTYLALLS